MSIFTNKVLPTLNGKRQATVKSYREVENTNGGYMETIWKLEDREFTYNIFPGKDATAGKQVNYVTSAIRRQLGKDEESLSLIEVLELAKTTPINMWFGYNQAFNRMDVTFHDTTPIETTATDTDITSIEA